ncbi:flagellar transcriptional regulator FlhC [Longibaculum muris]|jgi:predicted transposase YdaD|nr:flagellar transcriptional regulator FlhC [Longibaculum muris]
MNTRKQEQLKIAAILYDLGIDMELIEAMTSLSHEDLTKLYQ